LSHSYLVANLDASRLRGSTPRCRRSSASAACRAGGAVLFVRLACDRAELLRRVRSDARRARGKLTDPGVLVDQYDLGAPLPFEPHLWLDTTGLPPAEAAARIAAHFALPLLPADARPVPGAGLAYGVRGVGGQPPLPPK
jgi:hypothetical protein